MKVYICIYIYIHNTKWAVLRVGVRLSGGRNRTLAKIVHESVVEAWFLKISRDIKGQQ